MTLGLMPAAEPRPVVEDAPEGPVLSGVRCRACEHPVAVRVPRCPRCSGETESASFGPDGVLWSTTTFYVSSGEREAPYTLGYVDLDHGPRLLAHVDDGPELEPAVAERVRLTGRTPVGDPLVELVR